MHASDLFTTANSTRDLARVLAALDLGRVDLYGDSYGTYFAQAFLARFPQLLHSVVLDSAYEARDLDPWYRTTVTTARRAFDTVCARAPGCPPGSSWRRIAELARLLRGHPLTGEVVGTDVRRHRVTFDITALVNVVNDAGYDFDPYRQLDAAARAYLEHRDAVPLLRLYAQDVGYDYSDYQANAHYYSDGLYMAVACTDYPQLFDMRSAPAQRRRQLAASIRALPAGTFAPFTTREWLSVLPYTETYTGCLTWPRETHAPRPADADGCPARRWQCAGADPQRRAGFADPGCGRRAHRPADGPGRACLRRGEHGAPRRAGQCVQLRPAPGAALPRAPDSTPGHVMPGDAAGRPGGARLPVERGGGNPGTGVGAARAARAGEHHGGRGR